MEKWRGPVAGVVGPAKDFWRGKKVLITGHTGFKGAWLTAWLLNLGAEVNGYALEPATSPSLFALADLAPQINHQIGDVRDLEGLASFVKQVKPEIVFHMAAQALVLTSYEDPVGTYATNVMGTVHLLEALRGVEGVRAIVNITSDKCYENREWHWGYRERDPMGGYDPYSSSKACSELVTSAYRRSFYHEQGAVGVASARAGNVIGGGDWAENRILPDCMRALRANEPVIVRNPMAIRPWQHVLEPLGGYLLLAQNIWEKPQTFAEGWNFGPFDSDARPVSWIVERVTKLWGNGASWKIAEGIKDKPHEAGYLKLDCSKARAELKWSPRLDLNSALEWVVDWYARLENGDAALAITQTQIQKYMALGEENYE